MLYIWKPGPEGGAPPAGAGGKATGLAGLQAAGLPVPPWFVVLPSACRASVDTLRAELAQALAALPPGLVAVRSSAVDEDGAAHSFAGQLESFLNVPHAEVAARVAAVWQSAFDERSLAYRRERGIADPPSPPGVVVQVMVPADAAGVCFTSDPVSGRRGLAVVAAVSGLGERLVGGEADADTWWVGRAGHIERTNAVAEPVLTETEAAQVAALARAAAAAFGRPQDVEWTRAGGTFWLLQSRPITTLNATPDPDAPLVIWDNSNISESYGGVTTPLTFSFALGVYEAVYTQFLRLLLVPPQAVEAHRPALQQMLGLVDGRLYYNLLNWYRLLALMPGFKWNRGFMEQMMGVAEGLPPDVVAELERGGGGGRLADLLRLLQALAGLARAWATLPGRIRRFNRRLDEALQPPPVPLAAMRADELIAYYRRLEQNLLWSWDAPLINDFAAMVSFGLLRKFCVAWYGDTEGTLQNGLLANQGGMVSAEPAALIEQMGALAAADPTLCDRLRHPTAALARELAQSPTPFGRTLQAYLAKFGERCLEELKLESPTLHDDPAPLLAAVRAVAERRATQAQPAAQTVNITIPTRLSPWRGWLFNWALSQTRQRLRDRENLRLERTRVFGRVRAIVRELGARLFAAGRLDQPADVFYLELGELFSAFNGTATTTDLRALVALRRQEWEQYRLAAAPPSRMQERDGVRLPSDRPLADSPAGETMQGIGCCPGRVEGRVRVIRDPRHARIQPGEILVAERTDPGWVMLFPAAAGVLVERGSLLSHAAIVSRELALPAIVGLTGLTRWLADGDRVVFDGRTGVVERLERAATSREGVEP